VQWLEDTQIYNEWANEADYLVDNASQMRPVNGGGLAREEALATMNGGDESGDAEVTDIVPPKVNAGHTPRLAARFKSDSEVDSHPSILRVYNDEEEVCPAAVVRRPGRKQRRVQGEWPPESSWGNGKRPRTSMDVTVLSSNAHHTAWHASLFAHAHLSSSALSLCRVVIGSGCR
jgi:hypothetical protein